MPASGEPSLKLRAKANLTEAERQHQPIYGSRDGCIKSTTPDRTPGQELPLLLRFFYAPNSASSLSIIASACWP
jgi:hypothetical protein